MTETPKYLTLRFLRSIDSMLGNMEESLQEINLRLSHVEEGQTILDKRFDRLGDWVLRIERHLDVVEV